MILSALTLEFVEFIPERLREGVLYISRRYRTASHLCCCGCKREVVTPLNPAKWQLAEHPDGSITLSPSVGNWSFPCRSHYLIIKNRVHWAEVFTDAQIATIQKRDRVAVELLSKQPEVGSRNFIATAWKVFSRAIKGWFRLK